MDTKQKYNILEYIIQTINNINNMITDIIILKGTILLRNIYFCFDSKLFYIRTQIKNK